jgi:Zn-dependent protease
VQFDPVRIVIALVPMILSLSFHEFAHAFAAKMLGDDTAEKQGRLTLNPLVHIDPIGTLLIPVMAALTTASVPMIGWAKPTPVNTARFRKGIDPRRGDRIVSAAGPLSNLLLAIICAAILGFGASFVATHPAARTLLETLLLMNVGLCVLNFLPVEPLDGARLLPRSFDPIKQRISQFSLILLLVILWVPQIRRVVYDAPIAFLLRALATLFHLPHAHP